MQKIYQTNTSHGKTHCNAAFVGTHRNPCGIIIGAMDTAFGKILLEITGIRELYPLYLIPCFTACRYFNCILLSKVWRNQQ